MVHNYYLFIYFVSKTVEVCCVGLLDVVTTNAHTTMFHAWARDINNIDNPHGLKSHYIQYNFANVLSFNFSQPNRNKKVAHRGI